MQMKFKRRHWGPTTYHSSSLWALKKSRICRFLNSNLYSLYFLMAIWSSILSSCVCKNCLKVIIGGWVGPVSFSLVAAKHVKSDRAISQTFIPVLSVGSAVHLVPIVVMSIRTQFIVGERRSVFPIATAPHSLHGRTHIASVGRTIPFSALSAGWSAHSIIISVVTSLRNTITVLVVPITTSCALTP